MIIMSKIGIYGGTLIRERVSQGKSICRLTPDNVIDYIKFRGLYV